MNKTELEKRTMEFAIKIIEFVATLPKTRVGDVIGYQLVKAGTSVGANYREANRAESRKDFVHKLAIVEKEASESNSWLDICQHTTLGSAERRLRLLTESRELLAIFTSAGKTSKFGI